MGELSNQFLKRAEAFACSDDGAQRRRLREALEDYTNVCTQLESKTLKPDDRRQWGEIRDELVDEINRLTLNMGQSDSRTEGAHRE